jgi:hypothetical protein
MKIIKNIFLFFLFFSAWPIQASESIIINEIAWMGTTSSAHDEWIELFNTSDEIISVDNWLLESEDEKLKIVLEKEIPAKGFYLLERTDDTSIPKITADVIYTGALNNNGVKLKLIDNLGNLVDSVDCSSGWFFGDNETKKTMERIAENKWQTSQNSEGTPKEMNIEVKDVSQKPIVSKTNEFSEITEKSTQNQQESTKINKVNTAFINNQESTIENYYLFFFALLIALFAGILIFVIRNKIIFKRN